MNDEIKKYLKELDRVFCTGSATEHSYRPALQALLASALPGATAINEPRQIECGAPDFVLTRNQVPLGYIEAKDITKNLDDPAHKAQLGRYLDALDNLIFTNYIEFRWYRDGEQVAAVRIAQARGGRIQPKPERFAAFAEHLQTFGDYQGQTIASAADLARRMAAKARMLAAVVAAALESDNPDDQFQINEMVSELSAQLKAFRAYLIHDIQFESFADMYAQTVAYGMFAARLHDKTLGTFSRQEAAELIPVTNPFLRKFFQHIAGYDLDPRIRWIVDDLADIFRAADVGELMKDYGKATQRNDPFLHFYETFLGEYNAALRKSRGVYYTPEPIVDFIVRAVDAILRDQFKLPAGLADTSKSVIEVDAGPSTDKRKNGKMQKHEKEVHKVQILDPATGTGTFLAAIVRRVYEQHRDKGTWPDYVKNDLIPRLNGFEVLMASYAMAHTKLEMVLRDSGCQLDSERLRVFLTNSLEEHHPDTGTLFAQWLSNESQEANAIKRDAPVMVVIGNPPYSGESANKGAWICGLLDIYKQEPSGGKLKEKNPKWLNDDYVKFIRYGQHYIDRTGEGILAYINNHGFLDNPTFRGMRWNLLQSFDAIYIVDLHGNSKKKETAPDGSADENVFDIQQGVSINLLIKTGKKRQGELAKLLHFDLYGTRKGKYKFLQNKNLNQIDLVELLPQDPQYFFVPKNYDLHEEYGKGFSVKDFFIEKGTGIVTKRDKLAIHYEHKAALQAARDILQMPQDEFYEKYSLPSDVRDWRYDWAKRDIEEFGVKDELIEKTMHRLFDKRFIVYTGKTRGFIGWPVLRIMRHFLHGENLGLITIRRSRKSGSWGEVFVTDTMISGATCISALDINYLFPLYLYPDEKQQALGGDQNRKPNLNMEIIEQFAAKIGLRFTPEKENAAKSFAPLDLLDYIYAVLHAPSYRERYKEFLKIDFPRVTYPADQKRFRKLVKLGGELRALHLLESVKLNHPITNYPKPGDHGVLKPEYQSTHPAKQVGKVVINQTQYFENVPKSAWEFYIGGYQPAQKYLKDRKGRNLTLDEITHYQKIIVALVETEKLMHAIDTIMRDALHA